MCYFSQEGAVMKVVRIYLLVAACAAAQSEAPAGRWDATIVMGDLKIPFSMQLDPSENAISGTFVNGDEKTSSSAGSFSGDALRLPFPQYNTTLEAQIVNGGLKGKYGGAAFGHFDVEGGAYCTCASEGEAGPDISGKWTLTAVGATASRAWQVVVLRKGDDTVAHILRPDDTNGALTGRFDGLTFMLHHFDGARGSLLELEPRPDGALELVLKEPGAAVKKFRAAKVAR
jgi:hypothetical protein